MFCIFSNLFVNFSFFHSHLLGAKKDTSVQHLLRTDTLNGLMLIIVMPVTIVFVSTFCYSHFNTFIRSYICIYTCKCYTLRVCDYLGESVNKCVWERCYMKLITIIITVGILIFPLCLSFCCHRCCCWSVAYIQICLCMWICMILWQQQNNSNNRLSFKHLLQNKRQRVK